MLMMFLRSRNPFGAGTVFQYLRVLQSAAGYVAIPLEQGRFFNNFRTAINCSFSVAIPLEQGRFFNEYWAYYKEVH
ncbi:hypothetical protein HMPREF0198_1321 [Cardiobacterium hominis ATCC 15826]|uniref:Uncharacterized protein n=1 Tax=Cardiobacterium hominis (strain ATCC 15826 / DSM 8339 / NCTC 10426 / 6573) TaxID=638300 RepID=C8N9Z3_CARH6|nr:hypothetical protein HMPREF0198_1321 [Cardiobacterium hominis ATCC 15826]